MSRQKPTKATLPSKSRAAQLTGATLAVMLVAAGVPSAAQGAPAYTEISQSQLSIVDVDSVETSGEGANGAAELVLDGNPATYWHTKWQGGVAPLPHHITVKLADEPVNLGKIGLTPRQSSNGSGRVHEYQVWTSTDAQCAPDTFELKKEGAFAGEVSEALADREISFGAGVEASCAKLVYLSAWGGKSGSNAVSPTENVGSLAEFRAYTVEDDGTVTPPEPEQPVAVLAEGDLNVSVHEQFPQIVGYELAGNKVDGKLGAAINKVRVGSKTYAATSTPVQVNQAEASAVWTVSVAELNAAFDVTVSLKDGVIRYELSNLVDPSNSVNQLTIPGLDIVTLKGTDSGATIASTQVSVDRGVNGDKIENVASASASERNAWLVVPSTSAVSFGVQSNAIADHTSKDQQAATGLTSRWLRKISGSGDARVATISPNLFTWHGAATRKDGATIGADENPFIEIKPTLDANSDGKITWQDGATALRELREVPLGAEDVKNTVITRIPFNIVSQATHPFLRTLDDTKRISLATDGLGQQVMLKGYEAEGHDSAHPDYAGHYNTRAGGLEDLKTLVNEGENWNAQFGVHVNTTESYSEAYNFSEDLITMPPSAAWGWMNQSYYIDSPKDLATGKVLERFQEFRDEVPENLSWLYIDVYYPDGWQAKRLGAELAKQGWEIGSEWSDKLPDQNIWSHWANDENYGGTSNKGINSQIFRYIDNANRDIFNPDPILGNASTIEFEGWTGHVDYNTFIDNVWQRNLPTKFLQQSDIRTWEANKITFDNGTVATSPLTTIAGNVYATDREITFDGAKVYSQGNYLLPWTDGEDRLYHLNPVGGETTWELTDSWASQNSVTLYKLTETGREKVADLAVVDGSVTISADKNTPYVLYPTSIVPEVKAPNWGQDSQISDPGFFSGTLDAYTTEGDVKVVTSDRRNFQAELGAGQASLSQKLAGGNLPAGKWNASAWIEIQTGKRRDVTLSVTGAGVKPVAHQGEIDGVPATTFATSTAQNATASDEKFRKYFQRARVTFETTGGEVTFKIAAGDGDAIVSVDDLRLTDFVPAEAPASAGDGVIVFETFENADTGYWPFVTGIAQSGDARTQLAEIHAPYSQKGWWGKNLSGTVVEGGKIIDNVLDGKWSLMAHEENDGRILRTSPASVNFRPGRQYEISFDYQSGHKGLYDVVIGYDTVNGTKFTTTDSDVTTLGQVRDTERFTKTFSTGTCGDYFWAIDSNSSGSTPQGDLVLDNILVRDLGPAAEGVACAKASVSASAGLQQGIASEVTTSVTSEESVAASDVKHELVAPEGWTVVQTSAGESTVAPGATSTATWLVLPKAGDTSGQLTVNISYLAQGSQTPSKVSSSAQFGVITPLQKGVNYLSDLPFDGTPTNGWGPVERDQANGEQGRGDGPVLSLDGTTYEKGLGTHANSKVAFDLSNQCTTFSALVGVDDKQSSRGTVIFEVQDGNGKVLAGPTKTLTSTSASVELSADVTGVDTLVLIVRDAGDGNGNDWADWVNAKVDCADGVALGASATPGSAQVERGSSVDVALSGWSGNGADVNLYDVATNALIGTGTPDSAGVGAVTLSVAEDHKVGPVRILALQETTAGLIGAVTSIEVTDKPVAPEATIEAKASAFTKGKKPGVVVTSSVDGTATVTISQGAFKTTAAGDVLAGKEVTLTGAAVLPSAGKYSVKVELVPADSSIKSVTKTLTVIANEAAKKKTTVTASVGTLVSGSKPTVTVKASQAGKIKVEVIKGDFKTTKSVTVLKGKSAKVTLPSKLKSHGTHRVVATFTPSSKDYDGSSVTIKPVAKKQATVKVYGVSLKKGSVPKLSVKTNAASSVKVTITRGTAKYTKTVSVKANDGTSVKFSKKLTTSGKYTIAVKVSPKYTSYAGATKTLSVTAK